MVDWLKRKEESQQPPLSRLQLVRRWWDRVVVLATLLAAHRGKTRFDVPPHVFAARCFWVGDIPTMHALSPWLASFRESFTRAVACGFASPQGSLPTFKE